MNDILQQLKGGLIVSCQALPGEPLHMPGYMVGMAEAAKRAGLENQYEQITLEEKTLSNIANILADVKRQRYPGVPL